MRIAIISDVHGNLEALKKALEDIKKRNIDKIFCLGDTIAKGYHMEECVKLVRENCDIVIQGNCDIDFFPEKYTQSKHNIPLELLKGRANWISSMVSNESREYLLNLPFFYEFYMSGSLIRIFHAHPEKINKVLINEDSYDEKYKMFLPSDKIQSQKIADIVVYGHLHHQFMDKFYNKTLINCGSIGNSFDVVRDEEKDSNVMETTQANYLILEGEYGAKEYENSLSFEFIRVPYNKDKELEDLDKNLEIDAYKNEIQEGIYRNMSKIQEYSKKEQKIIKTLDK